MGKAFQLFDVFVAKGDRERHVLVAHRREALDDDRSRSQRHYVPIAPKNISGFRGPAFYVSQRVSVAILRAQGDGRRILTFARNA
jgi:hypothetical protein